LITSGSSTCDPTACTLYSSGCTTAYATTYPSGRISMAATSPWTLTMTTQSILAGWTETICLSCTNTHDTQATGDIVIIQSPNLCANSLGLGSPSNPSISAYHASNTATVGTWSTFITSSSSTCDPTSCTLQAQGCVNVYPGGRLSIGASPWTLTATSLSVEAGWAETICYKCTNGVDNQAFDNFVV
jgi:hypothetical protein